MNKQDPTAALRADGAVRLAKWKTNLLMLGNSDTVRNDRGIETPGSPELSSACVDKLSD